MQNTKLTKTLALLTLLSLVGLAAVPIWASACDHGFLGWPWQSKFAKSAIPLQNLVSSPASGSANVTSNFKNDLYDVKIKVSVQNLPPTAGFVYEGWLADDSSGYKLSLGGFTTRSNGKGELKYNQSLVNFPIYDKILVSQEPIGDTNPNPSLIILQASLATATTSPAQMVQAVTVLRGSNEVPSNSSQALGVGWFTIDTTANALKFNISYWNLQGSETGAHIHGFTSSSSTADVLFTLPSGSTKTGVWNYSESQEADILAGKTYVDIHSSAFPDGEIRGQITP